MIAARVTHRLCLDHPESVEKACLMDIAPTLTMYQGTNQEFATKYMWWFFLIQPYPLPEHMIGRDAEFYLKEVFGSLNKTPGAIAPGVVSEYVREFSNPDAIHSTCEDFRAAADIDLEMDKADDEAGKKIKCPLHVLWGGKNVIGSEWDLLATEVRRTGDGEGARLRSLSAGRTSPGSPDGTAPFPLSRDGLHASQIGR
jgi:haloacetate dehalogenase